MNISENKRVIALSAVFGIAFCGLMYKGYGSYSDAEANKIKLAEMTAAYEEFNGADFAPTLPNLKALVTARETLQKTFDSVDSLMKDYQKAASDATAGINDAPAFQKAYTDATNKLAAKAQEQSIILASPAAKLGLGDYSTKLANIDHVPYLAFLLAAVNNAANVVMDSDAAVVEKIYCAPIHEDLLDAKKSKRLGVYTPLRFEISFKSKRAGLPKVLNSLMSDKKFFYKITGLSAASNMAIPPAMSSFQTVAIDPSEVVAEGEVAPAASLSYEQVARPLTGQAEEYVHVHLVMEVLYFNKQK